MLFLEQQNLPNQIIFIRHGEKNDKNDDGNLNKVGLIHADCWLDFFKDKNRPSNISAPNSFYAMKKADKKDSSNRPYQTILPLANSYNLPINNLLAMILPPFFSSNLCD